MLEPAKRYNGYRAYQYLEAGEDYRDIACAEQLGRVPAYQGLDLTDAADRAHPPAAHRRDRHLPARAPVQVFPENIGADCASTSAGPRAHRLRGPGPLRDDRRLRQRHGRHVLHQQRRAAGSTQDVLFDLGVRMSDLAHQDYVVKARDRCRTSGTPTRPGRIAHRLRPRGRDDDRERGRPAGRPLRIRRPPDRHRLLRGQLPGQRPQGARRRRPDLLRRAGRAPDEQARASPSTSRTRATAPRWTSSRRRRKPIFITHCGLARGLADQPDEARRGHQGLRRARRGASASRRRRTPRCRRSTRSTRSSR